MLLLLLLLPDVVDDFLLLFLDPPPCRFDSFRLLFILRFRTRCFCLRRPAGAESGTDDVTVPSVMMLFFGFLIYIKLFLPPQPANLPLPQTKATPMLFLRGPES